MGQPRVVIPDDLMTILDLHVGRQTRGLQLYQGTVRQVLTSKAILVTCLEMGVQDTALPVEWIYLKPLQLGHRAPAVGQHVIFTYGRIGFDDGYWLGLDPAYATTDFPGTLSSPTVDVIYASPVTSPPQAALYYNSATKSFVFSFGGQPVLTVSQALITSTAMLKALDFQTDTLPSYVGHGHLTPAPGNQTPPPTAGT